MKKFIASLVLLSIASIASAQTWVTNAVPGGTFEPSDPAYPDITNSPASGGGTFVFTFPTSGGNPNGYAKIDSTAGGSGFAVLVFGAATPIDLSTLGLAPNVPCTFLMDMKISSGSTIGGLKVESWGPSGKISDTGDVRPASGGSTWVTYSFPFTPAPNATGVKIVPLWGANSVVDYDNLRVVAATDYPLTAAITFPAAAAHVGTNFTINATATVYPATVYSVDFYLNGTLLGTSYTAPYSFNVVGAPVGPAALTVVATDSDLYSVTSAPVNVTVSAGVTETIVKVDPTKNWQGFMNVFTSPRYGGGFAFNSPWGVADLQAKFSGAGPTSVLTLTPAPLNDTNSYWYDYTDPNYPVGTNGAVGFRSMEANMYVEAPGLNGNLVTFTGSVLTNTLVNPSVTNLAGDGWTSVAFVKDLSPDYSTSVETNIALTNGMNFSISLLTIADSTRHIQYGFRTVGPNVWPTDVTNYGAVVIKSLDASPTNVYVDSRKPWVGFMNVFNKPQDGGAYQFGSGWGTADLCAVFNGFGLKLSPNTIGDPASYWYTPSGGPGSVGNKTMDASMYVEIGSLPGRNLTFSGTVLSNTLVRASNTNAIGNGWTSVAFIKDFAPDYSSVNSVAVPLTPGAFSISMNTVNDPARHVQYGFETIGPDVWVTDVAPFGNVLIANVAVLSPTIAPSISGGNINLSFPTQTGRSYTVQFKTNLTDAGWSTLTTTNGTGVTAIVPGGSTTDRRFYRLTVQ
jgi:hypothetical protein